MIRPRRSRRPQSAILEDVVAAASTRLRKRFLDAATAELRGVDPERLWAAYQRDLARILVLVALLGSASVNTRLGFALPGRTAARRRQARFAALELAGLEAVPFAEAEAAFLRLLPDVREILESIGPTMESASARVVAQSRQQVAETLGKVQESLFRPSPGVDAAVRLTRREASAAITDALKAPAAEVQTILRTTSQAAYNEGTREQYRRNADVFPLFRINEIRDVRTRGNPRGVNPEPQKHWQMDGFVWYADDVIWDRIWTPNGWNCRGSVEGVTRAEAVRNGWMQSDGSVTDEDRARLRQQMASRWAIIARGEYPDPGFSGSFGKVLS